MNAEIINPFIKASRDILVQMAAIQSEMGSIYLKEKTFPSANVAILIGITGDFKGQAVLSMGEAMALKVASNMMGGLPVAALDDIAKSAISELGNMILGNAATLLYNQNIKIDITPPTLLVGENLSISTPTLKTLCIPLKTEFGILEIDIAIKE